MDHDDHDYAHYRANNDPLLYHAINDPAFTRYFVVYRKTLADFQRIWPQLLLDTQIIIDTVEEDWAQLLVDTPLRVDGQLIIKKVDIQLILEPAGMDLIGGWSSEPRHGPPRLRPDIIRLSQRQPVSDADRGNNVDANKDQPNDLFHLGPNPCNWSCKTGRRPYDLVVAAILLRAKQLAGKAIHIEFVIYREVSTPLICCQLRYGGPRGGMGRGERAFGEAVARRQST